jgi:hypothetical protein
VRAGREPDAMGTISLVIAAAMSVFGDSPQMWVSMFAAAFGVVSIAIGFGGVLYAGSKRRWLCNRLMTERLRQFHFQSFVCRWQEISDSMKDKSAVEKYEHQRDSWYASAFATLPAHLGAELTEILEDESDRKCWLHPLPASLPGDESARQLEQLLEAYRELRIQHQLHYANHQLRSGQDIFSWSPRLQSGMFFYITVTCILVIFSIHLWIAFSLLFGMSDPIDIHVAVVLAAIVALAARALQEGLQPEREIERYRHYRASIRAIRDRFDQATLTEKFEVMKEMERLSFDEMQNFLCSNNEARFVI